MSVIIAVHNGIGTIHRAIESALAQREAGEVIVVDDASTDNTADVARCADDATGRLRVICLRHNQGPAAARNHALDHATLPFVAVLDADDYMLPDRLERLVREADAGYDLVADDIVLRDEGSDEAVGSLFDVIPRVPEEIGFAAFVVGNLVGSTPFRRELGYLKPLMRRGFLEEHRLRYDPTLRLGEDFILYATALASGARFKLLTWGGYVAVARPDSLSHRHRTEDLRALLIADGKLSRRPGLSRGEVRAIRRHRHDTLRKYTVRRLLDIKDKHVLLRFLARQLRGLFKAINGARCGHTAAIPQKPARMFGAWLLVGSNVVRTGLQFMILPVLAARLEPEAYGLIGLAMPLIMLPRLLSDAGLEAALVLGRGDVALLEASCFWATLTIGVLLAAGVVLAAGPVAALFHQAALTPLLIGLSPILVLSALGTVPNARLRRGASFPRFAAADIVAALAGMAVALFGAFHGWGAWSLGGQQLALWTVKCGMVSAMAGYRPRFRISLALLRSHTAFGGLTIGAGLVDFCQRNLDNLILGALFGVEELGFYAIAYQIMRLAETLVAEPVGMSVFSATARHANEAGEAAAEAWLAGLRLLTLVLLPGLLGLGLVADLAVIGILGERWAQAGPVLAALMPAGFAQCVLLVNSNAILGFGRADLRLRLAIVSGVLGVAGIVAGARFGVLGVALGLSVGLVASVVPHLVIAMRLMRVTVRRLVAGVAGPVGAAVAMGVAVVGLRMVVGVGSPIWTLVECGGGGRDSLWGGVGGGWLGKKAGRRVRTPIVERMSHGEPARTNLNI